MTHGLFVSPLLALRSIKARQDIWLISQSTVQTQVRDSQVHESVAALLCQSNEVAIAIKMEKQILDKSGLLLCSYYILLWQLTGLVLKEADGFLRLKGKKVYQIPCL